MVLIEHPQNIFSKVIKLFTGKAFPSCTITSAFLHYMLQGDNSPELHYFSPLQRHGNHHSLFSQREVRGLSYEFKFHSRLEKFHKWRLLNITLTRKDLSFRFLSLIHGYDFLHRRYNFLENIILVKKGIFV